jgi:hypothetical protein
LGSWGTHKFARHLQDYAEAPPVGQVHATLPSEHPLGYHQACKGWKALLQMKNEAVKFQAFGEPFFYPFKRRLCAS